MQLMCDALSVLGSRHGLLINPVARTCGIIRFDRWDALPELHLKAGARIGDREVVFPLCPEGERFRFCDQRLTPCTVSLIGIDPRSAIKVKLTIATPFRPRDGAFSTIPVLAFRLQAERIVGNFRWERRDVEVDEVELFLETGGPDVTLSPQGATGVDLCFDSVRSSTEGDGTRSKPRTTVCPQHDRLLALAGARQGTRFSRTVRIERQASDPLDVGWCTYSEPNLSVQGALCPFKYSARFQNLDEVCAWITANPTAIFDNARRVDGIVARNNCSQSVNKLLAQTLHSWLIDTWWAVRPDGRDWFSVWEGSCYFHSTVDVEYTQSPFYLAVWPELLRIELDSWPEYSKDGTHTLGERGAGTLFLSHDTGSHSTACGQDYHHEMEVEETANYLILSYAYYRRTGDDSLIRKHRDTIAAYLAFLKACDTSGNGVPDKGVANTIDDASPAIQFGKGQIYLAVKCLVAFEAGAEFNRLTGDPARADQCRDAAQTIRALIEAKGWCDDHFVTLLEKAGEGIVDPWSGDALSLAEVPGWDAPHIYTVNGLVPMDMIGKDMGLNNEHIKQDLVIATERCLREYGCVHTDFAFEREKLPAAMQGLAGAARNPGWVSMNMLRDMAAFYRGVDLRYLPDRYWDWQAVTNTQEPKVFFETFNGNNLCFYPRGIAVWGYFDALGGLVIDRVAGVDRTRPALGMVRVPRLWDADWEAGNCTLISS